MCRAVRCRICGKTTWAGCGAHVTQVLASVPTADRCPGHPDHPPATSRSLLRRLFHRP